MCGFVGVFGLGGPIGVTDRALARMRDTLTHRGPDDAGVWRCPWAALGHRRLAVIAPGPEGHQPMTTPDGRYALAYNGELYNDAEVRAELDGLGVRFRTECDTETVLLALATWGTEAVDRFRGMFAFAFIDRDRRTVILSRDPMGIKPLYAARLSTTTGPQVAFASEPVAILAHPDARCEPDMVCLSAYLTTIRPTVGARTLFEGVETLLPGETRVYDASGDGSPLRFDAWDGREDRAGGGVDVGSVVRDSVVRHLRTDVPICALLSGGLDSAIVSTVTRDHHLHLSTYCAGAREPGLDDDFVFARQVAERLGTAHHEVVIDQNGFLDRWAWMVERSGVPLSTPNEVAIHEVAASLRADGNVVTVSGEGADELFGGYAPAMRQAAEHVAGLGGRADTAGGLFHLRSNEWVAHGVKPRVVRESVWERCGRDAELEETYREVFDGLRVACQGRDALEPHLRFHRRMNLPNLLRRLDSATMLASVEGRTPFADIAVCRAAESLPMGEKYLSEEPMGTKVALRRAFADDIPGEVLGRAKASFPLPFQRWAGGLSGVLRTSRLAHEVFTTEAVQTVSAAPEALWNLAWPMINVAVWGERWWGRGRVEPAMAGRITAGV